MSLGPHPIEQKPGIAEGGNDKEVAGVRRAGSLGVSTHRGNPEEVEFSHCLSLHVSFTVTRVIRNPAGMFLRNGEGWTADFVEAARFEDDEISSVFELIEKLRLGKFDVVVVMGKVPSSSDTVFHVR